MNNHLGRREEHLAHSYRLAQQVAHDAIEAYNCKYGYDPEEPPTPEQRAAEARIALLQALAARAKQRWYEANVAFLGEHPGRLS